MGGLLSTPSTNPRETQTQSHHTTAMSSQEEPSQTPESKRTQNESSDAQNPDTQEPINPEEEDEEEGECGFCLFMKGGGCRDSFVAWEKCIEEAEKNQEDIVDKCFEVTGALKKCMEAHSDYYAPILQAEKTAEEEAVRELENEKAKESGSSSSSSDSEKQGDSKGLEKNEGS